MTGRYYVPYYAVYPVYKPARAISFPHHWKNFLQLSFNEGVLLVPLNDFLPTTPNSESSRFDDLNTLPNSSNMACVSRGECENENMLYA